jgi:myo-inositol-1(or 4)-monophosphatase
MPEELQRRAAFAQHLADVSGEIIRPFFRRRITVCDKGLPGFFDPVTEADRRAEEAIRARIGTEFPQDGIIGEEFGESRGDSGFVWVIDPIDGTRSFVAGQPMWGTLIGLEYEGRPEIGVLDQPFLRERFTGERGITEMRDAQGLVRLKTRICGALADAVICTTHPMTHFGAEERRQFRRIEQACRFSRYGGDCYAYGLLAMGSLDLVVEAGLKHWDVAAVIPVVEGAGGVISDWRGGPVLQGGNVIAAGDAQLHAAAVAILSQPAPRSS